MQERTGRILIVAAIPGVLLMGVAGWWLGGLGAARQSPYAKVSPEAVAPTTPAPAPEVADRAPAVPDAAAPAAENRVLILNGQNVFRGGDIPLPPNAGNGPRQVVTFNAGNDPNVRPLPSTMQIVNDGGAATTLPAAELRRAAMQVVTITGKTGTTAIANVDANGNLTSITSTNPGVGITAAPTVNLNGQTSSIRLVLPGRGPNDPVQPGAAPGAGQVQPAPGMP